MANNINYTFGIDISRYQGIIDWVKIKASAFPYKIDFVAMRATISWGYVDNTFKRNWENAKKAGISRMAYMVFYPDQDSKRQADNLLEACDGDYGELPVVVDVELHRNVTPRVYQERLRETLVYLQTKTGMTPIVYSAASHIDAYVTGQLYNSLAEIPSWYNKYYWWMAHYLNSGLERNSPPAMPKGVTQGQVLIHQTTDKGAPIGVESKSLDYDRWLPTANVTLKQLSTLSDAPEEPEVPETPPVLETGFVKLKEDEYTELMEKIANTDSNGESLHNFAKNLKTY